MRKILTYNECSSTASSNIDHPQWPRPVPFTLNVQREPRVQVWRCFGVAVIPPNLDGGQVWGRDGVDPVLQAVLSNIEQPEKVPVAVHKQPTPCFSVAGIRVGRSNQAL